MPDDTVEIDVEHAETLLEAANTLVDDIASGRQWGDHQVLAEKNAVELDDARSALREAIDDA